jgi:hypothetical protein
VKGTNFREHLHEVTRKVKNSHQHKAKQSRNQLCSAGIAAESGTGLEYKIGPSTIFDFEGHNLTPYGGLLPVATMLDRLGFSGLVAQYVKVRRSPRTMTSYQFILTMVLGMYIGFARLSQLRFVASDPILKGIVQIARLPPQCTFWRFLAAWHSSVAKQLVNLQQEMRNRVWAAAHVRFRQITLDTDTTVHTLYGKQMGGRVSYAPKKKGARSHQPIFTFLAETREYVAGELRNGDRPSGLQIAAHLRKVLAAVQDGVRELRARADSGFYCWQAVEVYQAYRCHFILVARKTARLVAALNAAVWKPSPQTDADAECDFLYQPEGWEKPFRFIALRFPKPSRKQPSKKQPEAPEQYQLFETSAYLYRVFVTDLDGPVYRLVRFYNGRCASENLIKEANNDAGMSAHPYYRFDMNQNHFQLVMLAYNLNCWLALFHRHENAETASWKHITLATARLRFLFVAARLWRHAGRVGISYSDQYEDQPRFTQLMKRLNCIRPRGGTFDPVIAHALT